MLCQLLSHQSSFLYSNDRHIYYRGYQFLSQWTSQSFVEMHEENICSPIVPSNNNQIFISPGSLLAGIKPYVRSTYFFHTFSEWQQEADVFLYQRANPATAVRLSHQFIHIMIATNRLVVLRVKIMFLVSTKGNHHDPNWQQITGRP